MNQTGSNPMLDHLFARIVFYLVQTVPAGNCVLIEIPELEDDLFCLEQLMAIAEYEGEQEKKPIKAYVKDQVCVRHPQGATMVKDSFRKEVSGNRLCPNTIVVIVQRAPVHHLLFVVDHYLKLTSEGCIDIVKNRSGHTTAEPVPWESFRDPKYTMNDLLGRTGS